MPPDEANTSSEARPSSHYLSLRSRRSSRRLADVAKQQPPLPQKLPQYQVPPQPQQTQQPNAQTLTSKQSKRSLRHIFSRSKLSKDKQTDVEPVPPKPDVALKQNASPTYNLFSPEVIETSLPAASRVSSAPRSRSLQRQSHVLPSPATSRKGSLQESSSRESLAAWEMPQLFKAFPQTIRQATLAAVAMPTEMVLRLHQKHISAATEQLFESTNSKEKIKKRHGKNLSLSNLQWTTKIYLLVTSGYLLQYSGSGNYDRLPEKVLKLNQTSAAFVTDSIPGQHWVLQISSITEPDAAVPTNEPKSFLSKLSMLTGDRRDSANMLMVFDSADEMNSWMMTLRGEIEKLGGKRKMSEASLSEKPPVALQNNGRPIVVRSSRQFLQPDSPRFARSIQSIDDSDCTLKATDLHSRQHSLDDISTTNSVVSHDGKQLDNLRDSNGNRLSYSSTDRRTVITSAASSPDRSPMAEAFPRSSIESCDLHEESRGTDARIRPNASVISNRRSTMQNASLFHIHTTESQNSHAKEDMPAFNKPNEPIEMPTGPVAPNFSVPQSSKRRFSHARGSSGGSTAPSSPTNTSCSRITRSRPPPALRSPALRSSRPLSMVVDHHSPKADIPARLPTADGTVMHRLSPVEERRLPRRHSPRSSADNRSYPISPRSSVVGSDSGTWPALSRRTSPRRSRPSLVGLGAYRTSPDMGTRASRGFKRLSGIYHDPSGSALLAWAEGPDGRVSAMGPLCAGSTFAQRVGMRASTNPEASQSGHRRHSSSEEKRPVSTLPAMPPPPSGPLPALPDCASSSKTEKQRVLTSYRSMPQMNVAPAPPPVRELPPIPLMASQT